MDIFTSAAAVAHIQFINNTKLKYFLFSHHNNNIPRRAEKKTTDVRIKLKIGPWLIPFWQNIRAVYFQKNQLFIIFSSVKKSAHVIGQTIMCNQNILTSDRSYNISFIRHVK